MNDKCYTTNTQTTTARSQPQNLTQPVQVSHVEREKGIRFVPPRGCLWKSACDIFREFALLRRCNGGRETSGAYNYLKTQTNLDRIQAPSVWNLRFRCSTFPTSWLSCTRLHVTPRASFTHVIFVCSLVGALSAHR